AGVNVPFEAEDGGVKRVEPLAQSIAKGVMAAADFEPGGVDALRPGDGIGGCEDAEPAVRVEGFAALELVACSAKSHGPERSGHAPRPHGPGLDRGSEDAGVELGAEHVDFVAAADEVVGGFDEHALHAAATMATAEGK